MSLPAALIALAATACLGACDERDETFATPDEIAGMVEKGWLPPMPAEARNVRVAWNVDLNTSFFCGEVFWEDLLVPLTAIEDAVVPDEQPEAAPAWWWAKARSGTEAVRVPGRDGRGWTLTQVAPTVFCGADLDAWRGAL